MQSVDEFKPSTTEPVFGSGLTQTKIQQQTDNDIVDSEKSNPPPSEPLVNGQNDTSNENISNGKIESVSETTGAGDSSAIHVNGQSENATVETNNEIKPVEQPIPTSESTEKPGEVEPPIAEPEPVLSKPVDTVNEGSTTATVETPSNDNVPEVSATTEQETPERKSKSPRGKAKSPVVSVTPTRQSTRAKKTSSYAEDNSANEETGVIKNQNDSSKRQATNNQLSNNKIADDQAVISSDNEEKASPSARKKATGKKRGASTSTTTTAKKTKGKKSNDDDDDSGAGTSEGETVQTPPKKARTSGNKKTPEPTGEYVRKLRPRK